MFKWEAYPPSPYGSLIDRLPVLGNLMTLHVRRFPGQGENLSIGEDFDLITSFHPDSLAAWFLGLRVMKCRYGFHQRGQSSSHSMRCLYHCLD